MRHAPNSQAQTHSNSNALNFNVYLIAILLSSNEPPSTQWIVVSVHCFSRINQNRFQNPKTMFAVELEGKTQAKRQRNKLECVLNYKITQIYIYIYRYLMNELIPSQT